MEAEAAVPGAPQLRRTPQPISSRALALSLSRALFLSHVLSPARVRSCLARRRQWLTSPAALPRRACRQPKSLRASPPARA
eukprot:3424737-Prymnesium_polylepis.1